MVDSNLPNASEKPDLLAWLETFLPFRFPRIPLVQTAKNLDKAAAMAVLASGENVAARIKSSTSRIEARSTAERVLIEYGQSQISASSPQLADRALEYAVGDAIRRQENREEILKLTAEQIAEDPPREDAATPIDDDWLDAFKRYAETKSKSDVQQLWARILSAEIRKPGTTSLRTIDFLSTISSVDANFIVKNFRYVFDKTFLPNWATEKELLSYSDLLTLKDLGIISEIYGFGGPEITKQSAQLKILETETNVIYAVYFDRIYFFQNDERAFKISIGASPLSKIGLELFSITQTHQPDYEAIDRFAISLKTGDAKKLEYGEITEKIGDRFRFGNLREL